MTSKKFDAPENWKFSHFTSHRGGAIRYGCAVPARSSLGTVVITGGYGRHIEYYYEKINNWLDRGYTVYAMDWDGQGGSSRANPQKPDRPAAYDFDHHIAVFDQFVKDIVRPAKDRPAFLSSHSKGGNIMLRYLRLHGKDDGFPFCGAILGAPMIDINTSPLPRRAFRRAVRALFNIGARDLPLPSPPKLLVDFMDAVAGRGNSPRDFERERVHEGYKAQTSRYEIGFPTVGWLRAALRSCDTVMDDNFLHGITTPVLILSSATDSLVCVRAQTRAADLLPNGSQIIFEGARHGIWYDVDAVQGKMWRAIDDFIAPLAATPARGCPVAETIRTPILSY